MRIKEEIGLTFDDLLLSPRRSTILSRFSGEVDLSTQLAPNIRLKIPIISANMDTISEHQLVSVMNSVGATGIIHRFMSIDDHWQQLYKTEGSPKIGCVGVGDGGKQRMDRIVEFCDAVLIDVAHGHSDAVIDQAQWIKNKFPEVSIIAGNVATYSGAYDLISAGVHSIKVGVGCGSLCSTRLKTGCGVPQATAIMECSRAINDWCKENSPRPSLIADGGIRNSGDIIKSLALGADAVMIGSILSGTEEAPGKCIQLPDNKKYKMYRGLASISAQEDWKGYATSVEGEMMLVSYRGPVSPILKDTISGILSGMSYQDARNLNELRNNAMFVRQTSAGIVEARPHALFK